MEYKKADYKSTTITQAYVHHIFGLAAFRRGRELSTLVVILSVCHNMKSLGSSNLKIACSTATSVSPLIGKVIFYHTCVSRQPRKV